MEILVRITQQYGNQRIFPVCEKAELFCQLVGGKTLGASHIDAIKKLGFYVTVVPDVTNL